MFGVANSDSIMQMTHELEITRRANEVLSGEKTALEKRVAKLENENVRLKLHFLKNKIKVSEAA